MNRKAWFVCVLVVGTAACSNELSRSRAAQLITQAYGLPAPVTVTVPRRVLVSFNSVPSSFPSACLSASGDTSADQARLAAYKERGLVALTHSREVQGGCIAEYTNVELTAEGQKYSATNTAREYVVRVYDRTLDGVTGIRTVQEGKVAIAEFTTKSANSTPFALNIERPRTQQASFALFDDGWRISR